MANPVIKVDNVFKSFEAVKAVNGVSFEVPEGSCFGLLGPNGAGKTTMMKMIYGVCLRDRTPAGRISVFGHDPQINPLAIKFISGVVRRRTISMKSSTWSRTLIFMRGSTTSRGANLQAGLRNFSTLWSSPKSILRKSTISQAE